MISLLETAESLDELNQRMADWCLVEVEDQTFNCFPDTRRLPIIWRVLTREQRGSMVGPTNSWRLIGLNGLWGELMLDLEPTLVAEFPALDRLQ